MSFFFVGVGLHNIDLSQNMVRFSYHNLKNAVNVTIQSGAPLTATLWEQDVTAFGNSQDSISLYLTGIWFIVISAIFNFLAFFILLEVRIKKWFGDK